MKEIDFIPEWYKRGAMYQIIYRSQYFVLAGIFVIIVVWNFISAKSVSNATAEINQIASKYAEAEESVQKFANLQKQLDQLKERADLLEEIDSRINVPGILAEISYLVDDRIVLNEVKFAAEEFVQNQPNQTAGSSTVRDASFRSSDNTGLAIGNVKFKITIRGVSTDASDAARLICKLEDSPYFFRVIPVYSRNTTKSKGTDKMSRELGIAKADATGDYRLNEFEINCYLENYRQQTSALSEQNKSGAKQR
jgi:Tfp pilus assembly protein PilN